MNDIYKVIARIKKIEIKMHPKCADELSDLAVEPYKEVFLYQFYDKLRYLEEDPLTYRKNTVWFGALQLDKKYSKMIFPHTKRNERIIFRLAGKPIKAYLLYAFCERSGAEGRDRGYTEAKSIVNKRYEEVLRIENN